MGFYVSVRYPEEIISPPPPPAFVQEYRKPHDREIVDYDKPDWTYVPGRTNGPIRFTVRDLNKGMPEVYRIMPQHTVPIRCDFLKLWKSLNPMLGNNQFFSILADNYAFTNNTGLTRRYNCITGSNAGKGDPALHTVIICGGAILRGREGNSLIQGLNEVMFGLAGISAITSNNVLWLDYIDINKPVPTTQEVLDKRLWFYGTTITTSGTINYMMKKGQDGQMHRVRVPLMGARPLYVPLRWLHKLDPGQKVEANRFA